MSSEAGAPAVGLATCADYPTLDGDGRRLLRLLRDRGVPARPAVWDDPAVDWASFRLVVVRSTWDYPGKLRDFLAWAGRLPRVLNPCPVLRWNADKRYLADLAAAGLPVVPTRFLGPADAFEPPAGRFVVKPSVSCGCRDTARYGPGQAGEAREHVRRLHGQGRTAVVQPYLGGVEEHGEWGLVFLGGRYSHAVRRGALLAGGRPAGREDVRPHEATAGQRSLAERALAAVPGGSPPLYGRVDLLPDGGHGLAVLEVEVLEPSLFLGHGVGCNERLADLIASAAGQLMPGGERP
jgi:hypothetical protein